MPLHPSQLLLPHALGLSAQLFCIGICNDSWKEATNPGTWRNPDFQVSSTGQLSLLWQVMGMCEMGAGVTEDSL